VNYRTNEEHIGHPSGLLSVGTEADGGTVDLVQRSGMILRARILARPMMLSLRVRSTESNTAGLVVLSLSVLALPRVFWSKLALRAAVKNAMIC